MARATARVCTEPGCPTIIRNGNRCTEHQRARDAHQRATTPTKVTRTWAERQRRAQTVADHKATHGNWCPGYQVPAHASDRLTADHITPVAAGGAPDGPLGVLCVSCNSRKGARVIQGRDTKTRGTA
ncbi:5-methylcytosine-specific restriction protein A [Rhodococcus sp. LBL1]|nr:5-methylcytosine-specific restriction protein A [Rhodococcus sp. LBL1]MDH6685019.1 5-methylcytosine-specific restriction protein A [Rhodococcus sp. LBL2]